MTKKKDIPFFKLILDIESLLYRYHAGISSVTSQFIWERILIKDFDKIARSIIFTFEKIISLSDDLFCTGDIRDNDKCIKTYEQYINNEPFDFWDHNGEIKLILS